MATSSSLYSSFSNPNFTSSHHRHTSSLTPLRTLKLTNPAKHGFTTLISNPPPQSQPQTLCHRGCTAFTTFSATFHGLCYVVGDNIDTDQIIPAEYLTLVSSKTEEYAKLGSYALVGLPSTYTTQFVDQDEMNSKYSILIADYSFGCGSSREHAPVALGASGVLAVVAESYARIFFRNSMATGEVYPLESEVRICEECRTGDVVTIELGVSRLINHTTGKEYTLKPIGDAGPVIDAGGIFAYARKTGMTITSCSKLGFKFNLSTSLSIYINYI